MSTTLKNAVRAEIECRAQRYASIPSDLLGEPAWDILLDLAISLLEKKRIQITAVGLNAGLAPTTALRWVCRLEERGLIRRVPDRDDGRRTWLEILPETMAKLAACFGYEWPPSKDPRRSLQVQSAMPERPLFFQGDSEEGNRKANSHLSLIEGSKAKPRTKINSQLLKRATDWVNQDYDERLSFAAQALYVHGYLSPHEYRRVELQIREDAEQARDEKVKARSNSSW